MTAAGLVRSMQGGKGQRAVPPLTLMFILTAVHLRQDSAGNGLARGFGQGTDAVAAGRSPLAFVHTTERSLDAALNSVPTSRV